MNELITLLIILAAIISFINKILGNKKKQTSTKRPSVPKPEPIDWVPPWSESGEFEPPVQESKEMESEIIEDIETKPGSVPAVDQKQETFTGPASYEEIHKPVKPKLDLSRSQTSPKKLEALGINLSSRDELRRGIIYAEILGQCRARRNLRRS